MSDKHIGCEILNAKINFGWKKPQCKSLICEAPNVNINYTIIVYFYIRDKYLHKIIKIKSTFLTDKKGDTEKYINLINNQITFQKTTMNSKENSDY